MNIAYYYPNLSDLQIEQFEAYKTLLLEWNKKINLISKNDESKIELNHFVDSLAISNQLKNKNKGIDIGSGAGFPDPEKHEGSSGDDEPGEGPRYHAPGPIGLHSLVLRHDPLPRPDLI